METPDIRYDFLSAHGALMTGDSLFSRKGLFSLSTIEGIFTKTTQLFTKNFTGNKENFLKLIFFFAQLKDFDHIFIIMYLIDNITFLKI